MTASTPYAEALAAGGLDWLLRMARETPDGPAWTSHPGSDEIDLADQLNNGAAKQAARRALARVRVFFDGERWGPQFDLLGGNAGIALGALRVGDVELAEEAVTPYLRTAEGTSHGVTWKNRTGLAARRHHLARIQAGGDPSVRRYLARPPPGHQLSRRLPVKAHPGPRAATSVGQLGPDRGRCRPKLRQRRQQDRSIRCSAASGLRCLDCAVNNLADPVRGLAGIGLPGV